MIKISMCALLLFIVTLSYVFSNVAKAIRSGAIKS